MEKREGRGCSIVDKDDPIQPRRERFVVGVGKGDKKAQKDTYGAVALENRVRAAFTGFSRWPMNVGVANSGCIKTDSSGTRSSSALDSENAAYLANETRLKLQEISPIHETDQNIRSEKSSVFNLKTLEAALNSPGTLKEDLPKTASLMTSLDEAPSCRNKAPIRGERELCEQLKDILIRKKSELFEETASKESFKEFIREFRMMSKKNWSSAFTNAITKLYTLPHTTHWRVAIELGDLCKRHNRIQLARKWYQKVINLQPFASQGWIESIKIEEEYGDLQKCRDLIYKGLLFCPLSDALLIKSIRWEERQENIAAVRALLASLRTSSLERVWKVLYEGALVEARLGKISSARTVFEYLMRSMPWYGPVYLEAFRLEEKHGNYPAAISIIERGLVAIPRYGPLWFGAFRLYEKSKMFGINMVRKTVCRAIQVISKELAWKVYLEAAQVQDRNENFDESRIYFKKSIRCCPKNLRWKVWLGAARMELRSSREDIARQLLSRSLDEVPLKSRSIVSLELSRLEEYMGNIESARAQILRACQETKFEWKVFLESVLLEIRAGNVDSAINVAEAALEIHNGTGRLWAVLIHLKQIEGHESQFAVFKRALKKVPKSGEVWCEGARICLDPTSRYFNLKNAKKYLEFAVQFTPQYGDSFVEFLRLQMLLHGASAISPKLTRLCINADPNYGAMWFRCKKSSLHTALEVLQQAQRLVAADLYRFRRLYQRAIIRSWCGMTSNAEDDSMQEWLDENINSLKLLYPAAMSLSDKDRHCMLFGSSASFHD